MRMASLMLSLQLANCLGRVGRYGPVAEGLAWKEVVCHWGWDLRIQKPMPVFASPFACCLQIMM